MKRIYLYSIIFIVHYKITFTEYSVNFFKKNIKNQADGGRSSEDGFFFKPKGESTP